MKTPLNDYFNRGVQRFRQILASNVPEREVGRQPRSPVAPTLSPFWDGVRLPAVRLSFLCRYFLTMWYKEGMFEEADYLMAFETSEKAERSNCEVTQFLGRTLKLCLTQKGLSRFARALESRVKGLTLHPNSYYGFRTQLRLRLVPYLENSFTQTSRRIGVGYKDLGNYLHPSDRQPSWQELSRTDEFILKQSRRSKEPLRPITRFRGS